MVVIWRLWLGPGNDHTALHIPILNKSGSVVWYCYWEGRASGCLLWDISRVMSHLWNVRMILPCQTPCVVAVRGEDLFTLHYVFFMGPRGWKYDPSISKSNWTFHRWDFTIHVVPLWTSKCSMHVPNAFLWNRVLSGILPCSFWSHTRWLLLCCRNIFKSLEEFSNFFCISSGKLFLNSSGTVYQVRGLGNSKGTVLIQTARNLLDVTYWSYMMTKTQVWLFSFGCFSCAFLNPTKVHCISGT